MAAVDDSIPTEQTQDLNSVESSNEEVSPLNIPTESDLQKSLDARQEGVKVDHQNMIVEPKTLQINLHIKKIQLKVPSQLKVKLCWLRGSKKLETKKKAIVDAKNSTVAFNETMSLITKFNPDSKRPNEYKKKKCYIQLIALTKGQSKPVGMLQFNLSNFLSVPTNTLMKLTFNKCFDKKAAIYLTTSFVPIEGNLDHLETESSITCESISDTFSEYSMNQKSFSYRDSTRNHIQSNVETCEGSSFGSFHGCHSRSESFSSALLKENKSNTHIMQSSELSKKDLEIKKLKNEVEHYKSLLSEMSTKYQDFVNSQSSSEDLKEQLTAANKKIAQMEQNSSELSAMVKESESQKHKMKMKIDYLTNKCFQLSCKIDKNDTTREQNKHETDLEMLVDILKRKQADYFTEEIGVKFDPTDFVFNIFTQFEQMKHDYVETKIKWAEAEGEKEMLLNQVRLLKSKLSSPAKKPTSYRSSWSLSSYNPMAR